MVEEIRFVALTVMAVAPSPAATLPGVTETIDGTGFEGGGGVEEFESPPQLARATMSVRVQTARDPNQLAHEMALKISDAFQNGTAATHLSIEALLTRLMSSDIYAGGVKRVSKIY